jgi:MSHA biogenesis protein MshP
MKLGQRRAQSGFGVIAAIVVLVILSALAAAIVSLSTTQQKTSSQDILSSRAWQAARSGNEWGLFQARNSASWGGAGTCDTATRTVTLDLTADTGFFVTVTCSPLTYNEGEVVTAGVLGPQTTRFYTITAVACPVNSCPQASATVATPNYVERTRVVIATQ